jgi:hypothetical protein
MFVAVFWPYAVHPLDPRQLFPEYVEVVPERVPTHQSPSLVRIALQWPTHGKSHLARFRAWCSRAGSHFLKVRLSCVFARRRVLYSLSERPIGCLNRRIATSMNLPLHYLEKERMMSRNLRFTALLLCTFALVAIVADLAQAQQRRRSWRFYGDTYSVGVALLQLEEVQAELKLKSDQITKATEIEEKLSQDRREIYSGLSREDWRERADELSKKTTELAKTAALTIAESLDDAQKKRWLEVALQAHGAAALPGEYLAERLQLNDGQAKKLNDLTAAHREKMMEMFGQSQGLSREERAEKFTALTAETNKKRMAVLNDAQKEAFKEMQGEKLELPEP